MRGNGAGIGSTAIRLILWIIRKAPRAELSVSIAAADGWKMLLSAELRTAVGATRFLGQPSTAGFESAAEPSPDNLLCAPPAFWYLKAGERHKYHCNFLII